MRFHRHPINRYIYLLVAIFLLIFGSVASFGWISYSKIQTANTLVHDFHFTAIEKLADMKTELILTDREIHEAIHNPQNTTGRNLDKLNGLFYLTQRYDTELRDLYSEFDSKRLKLLYLEVSKIRGKVESQFRSFIEGNIRPADLNNSHFDDAILGIERIQRLHKQKKSTLSEQLAESEVDSLNTILTFGLISIILIIFSIWKITRYIGEATIQQEMAQKSLKEINIQLEERVDARTQELDQKNKDLDIALEKSQLATKAKSEFLANMSHEIRTPMNGVLGMLSVLKNTNLAKDQREFVDTAFSSGETLLTILNDVLDFSKNEAGKLDLEKTRIELRCIVEDVANLFAERVEQKDVELLVDFEPSLPNAVLGDSVRIRQVLSNLIGNAVKFTEQGEILLSVSTSYSKNNEPLLHFSVKDTGIGISKEAQEKIFDAFSQEDGSTTRRFGGTGLGLTICRQIVVLMGGEIGIESQINQGSTFWFTLPFEEAEEQTVSDFDAKRLSKVKTLIVDDNETNCRILEHQLEYWGMTYQSVYNGKDALLALLQAASNHEPYDIVLLDMMMPGMDGMELARQIRSSKLIKDTKLIMLTSLSRVGESQKAKNIGIDIFLTKPARQKTLYESIITMVDKLDNGASKEEPDTSEPAVDQGGNFSNRRILVAEDYLINQKVISAMLAKFGCQIDIVENGRLAIDALDKYKYDLILMDCQMPEMDGYEATEAIRKLETEQNGAHMTIIAMTANAMKGDREKCLACGMDDYISKPIDPNELETLLNKWIGSVDDKIQQKLA